ncbi:YfhD family protein [Bacillus cereus]
MNKKNFKQSKATDGIHVEFSRELADHNVLEANARANAADARQKRQPTLFFSKGTYYPTK